MNHYFWYNIFVIAFIVILYFGFVKEKRKNSALDQAKENYDRLKKKIECTVSKDELNHIELIEMDNHYLRFRGKVSPDILNQQLLNLSSYIDNRVTQSPLYIR